MPMMPLRFPKYVEIVNPRLSLMYYGLMFIILAVLVARFVVLKLYYREVPFSGGVHVSLWANGDLDELRNETARQAGEDFCLSPRDYDYKSEEGQIAQVVQACLNMRETYMREGEDRLLLVTQVQETWLLPDENIDTKRVSQAFVPSVEALHVHIAYDYSVPGDDPQAPASRQMLQLGAAEEQFLVGSSATNILTVIMDSAGPRLQQHLHERRVRHRDYGVALENRAVDHGVLLGPPFQNLQAGHLREIPRHRASGQHGDAAHGEQRRLRGVARRPRCNFEAKNARAAQGNPPSAEEEARFR